MPGQDGGVTRDAAEAPSRRFARHSYRERTADREPDLPRQIPRNRYPSHVHSDLLSFFAGPSPFDFEQVVGGQAGIHSA